MVISDNQYLGPTYIDGDLTVEANAIVTLEGTVYVTGTITVNNGRFQGEHSVVAEGNITISGGGIGSPNIPLLTSVNGSIILQGAAFDLVDAVVYAPNGSVTLANVFALFGAIGGNTVTVDNSRVIYAESLRGRADLPGGLLHTLAYSYD